MATSTLFATAPSTLIGRGGCLCLFDELGVEHLNLLASFFGFLPANQLLSSLALFSSEVMPRLTGTPVATFDVAR